MTSLATNKVAKQEYKNELIYGNRKRSCIDEG